MNHFVHLNTYCSPLYPVSFGGNELFVGRAGYLAGVLWLQKELQKQILPVDTINEICHSIVQDGRKYASVHRSPMPLMYSYYDTEYIGKNVVFSVIEIFKSEIVGLNIEFFRESINQHEL